MSCIRSLDSLLLTGSLEAGGWDYYGLEEFSRSRAGSWKVKDTGKQLERRWHVMIRLN